VLRFIIGSSANAADESALQQEEQEHGDFMRLPPEVGCTTWLSSVCHGMAESCSSSAVEQHHNTLVSNLCMHMAPCHWHATPCEMRWLPVKGCRYAGPV
jgi:hypothetical protein